MARPPVIPAEEKVRIVLSILDAGMPTHEVLCGHRRARADLAPPQTDRTSAPGSPQVINGIRWRIRTAALWRDIQDRYGPWETCYCLFRTWQRDGTGSDVLTKLQARADRYLVTVQIAALVEWLR
jgi:transposase